MENRNDSRKRLVLVILAVLLTACLLFLVFRIFLVMDAYFGKVDTSGDDNYDYRNGGRPEYLIDGKWYVQKERVEAFLLIGIDKYEAEILNENGYRNTEQSDALFLLAIDHDSKTFSILHINRDTIANIRMLDVNGNPYSSFEGQLALSHTYGSGKEDSCENTVWSVSNYLYGLQIDHYAALTMDAVAVLNDAIGGVTLTVSDDMTAIDEALQKGKTVTLKGDQALTYVRARQGVAHSTNLERMQRQRQYVDAFLEQMHTAITDDQGLFTDMLLSIADYLVSDMTADELVSLSDVIYEYQYEGIITIDGEARMGEKYIEFYADEASLQQTVLKMFYAAE